MNTLPAYRRYAQAQQRLHSRHDEAKLAILVHLIKHCGEIRVAEHWERINKILDEQRNEA